MSLVIVPSVSLSSSGKGHVACCKRFPDLPCKHGTISLECSKSRVGGVDVLHI